MRKSHLTFIAFVLLIAVAGIFFVTQSHRQQQQALEQHLQDKIVQVRSSFDLALVGARQQLTEIASFVANSPAIQQTFLAGRKAVELEGGGAGGELAAQIREKLLTLSQGRWQELELGFDFLQMHYHLPGKVTSFLRVHRPESFGDLLVPFRHILPEAHEKQAPVSGLEIGRNGIYIRGVAPVFAYDSEVKHDAYVGSLEFAASLQGVIEKTARNQGVDMAVLLDLAVLQDVVWPGRLQELLLENGWVENFLIAESSLPQARDFFAEEDLQALLGPDEMTLHAHEGGYHWMAAFPIRDYWGELNPQRPPVGMILISSDATESQLLLQANLQQNIISAVVACLVLALLLWFALQFTARKLERLVEEGREQLEIKNLQLQDELTAKDELQQQRETLIADLRIALEDVKALSGLLPICSYCKKIRDDEGYWQRLEAYIENHSDAQFSHGICHDCLEENFPEMQQKIKTAQANQEKPTQA
jgi:hypothetical protein